MMAMGLTGKTPSPRAPGVRLSQEAILQDLKLEGKSLWGHRPAPRPGSLLVRLVLTPCCAGAAAADANLKTVPRKYDGED